MFYYSNRVHNQSSNYIEQGRGNFGKNRYNFLKSRDKNFTKKTNPVNSKGEISRCNFGVTTLCYQLSFYIYYSSIDKQITNWNNFLLSNTQYALLTPIMNQPTNEV